MFKKRIGNHWNVPLLGITAVPIGVVIGIVDAIFREVLLLFTEIRMEYAFGSSPPLI